MKHKLDVVFVDYKTPELSQIVIDSFSKFTTSNFDVRIIIIENSEFELSKFLDTTKLSCIVVNNPTDLKFSYAHGFGLEKAKNYIRDDASYVFTCHNDTCVTSKTFFDEIQKCIEEDVAIAGICEDKNQERIKALHCSGLLVKKEIYQSVSLMPYLPKIDTADLLTEYCRNNNLKTRLFKNTHNDDSVVDICNSPFKELGKNCGVTRCLDSDNNVMFIHQGRGTTKYFGVYDNNNSQKIMSKDWKEFCNSILE